MDRNLFLPLNWGELKWWVNTAKRLVNDISGGRPYGAHSVVAKVEEYFKDKLSQPFDLTLDLCGWVSCEFLKSSRVGLDCICQSTEGQGTYAVVESQEEALKREGMVFIRAARLRWEKVADYLCGIVQYILEVDSLYMEYEHVLVWHATLCQTMEYPTVSTLAQSLYDVIESMSFQEDSEFEFAVNHLSRWMEPFESLEDNKDSVF
jgi:hypothetical protein